MATTIRRVLWVALLAMGLSGANAGWALADDPAAPPAQDLKLSEAQQQIAEQYRHFEDVLLRMAELTEPTDPQRAALLRKAVAQSKEALISGQFGRLVKLLSDGRLGTAITQQKDVQQDLAQLLTLLLSEDRAKRLASEQARYREYIKRVDKLIKEEQAIKDQTERGADERGLAGRQGGTADKAKRLAQDIRENEEGGDGSSGEKRPGDKDGENKDGQNKDGENKDGQGKDGEGKDGQSKDGESKDGEGKDGEGKDGASSTPKEGEGKEGEGKDGQGKDGQGKDGQGKDGKGKDGEGKDGEGKDGAGQGKEGQSKEGTPKDGEAKPGEGKPGNGEPKPGEGQGQGEGEGEGEGQGGGQQKPANPARQKIENAENRMRSAQEKLEKAQRKGAAEEQAEAIRELEQAKAELEQILRQLREEQLARTLAMLEARFRKMLEMQVEVYESTLRLDRVPLARRGRAETNEAGRLSRKEGQIALEADRALDLLREEGSSVAMPEAVEQARDDMQDVVRRLAETKTDDVTQGLEEDIIAALEEMIAALEKAQKELEQQKGQPPPPGEPQDPPLIDKLAELKMIRSLQMRINLRTARYSKLVEGEQADDPDLLEALDQLSQKQAKVTEVTRDIVKEKTE